MAPGYGSWDGPARTLARGVDAAVTAADDADADAFDEALADLHGLDRTQLLVLLGTATADLLERAAPDGLDADEAERVLRGTLHEAAAWYAALDTAALLRAFTASVGIADPDARSDTDPHATDTDTTDADERDPDPDAVPPPTPDAVLAHGVLLVSYLCRSTTTPLPTVVDHALGELRRAQTMEMP